MKSSIILVAVLLYASLSASAQTNTIDTELSLFAENLAGIIKERGSKKVTVLDFTDLQGHPKGELGRYIAEQLTVNLVIGKRDFAVLDRANLKSILAEHKLTASGLVDPENAKKLGMFAGVDALILGTIITNAEVVNLTAKIITTETAQIIGAARATFKMDETVRPLMFQYGTGGFVGSAQHSPDTADSPSVTKTIGDLNLELQPLRVVNNNELLLTMTFSNRNPRKTISVALSTGTGFPAAPKAVATDSEGMEFLTDARSVSGITVTTLQGPYTYGDAPSIQATDIKSGEPVSVSIKFSSRSMKPPAQGSYRLQMDFVVAESISGRQGIPRVQTIITKIEAN